MMVRVSTLLASLAVGVWLIQSSGCTTQPSSSEQQSSETVVRSQGGDQDTDVTMSDVERETQEALSTAHEFKSQTVADYRDEVEQRLATIQTHVDRLKQIAGETTEELTPEVRESFDEMEQKIARTRTTLQEMRADTAEAWASMRDGMDAAISEIEKSAQDVRNQLAEESESEDSQSSTSSQSSRGTESGSNDEPDATGDGTRQGS